MPSKQFARPITRKKQPAPLAPQVMTPVTDTAQTAPLYSVGEVLQLQRSVGNRAAMGVLRPSVPFGRLQRLMSADDLIAKAGEPQQDRFFGLKKMSAKYKAIFALLRAYDDRLSIGVDVAGPRFAEGLGEQLDDIVRACNGYATAHPNDERTPHIVALRDVDVAKERGVLALITGTPALREQFAGKSIREAIPIGRDHKAIQTAVQSVSKPTPSSEKQEEAKAKYGTFLSSDNTGLTDTIQDETKNSGTQPFRGNADTLTKQGKLLTQTVGQGYIKTTVMPLISSLLAEVIGKEVLTTASPLNSPEGSSAAEREKIPATMNLVNQLYGQLVQGLLLDSKGGIAIPKDILDAAAATFARVYETVSTDPKAQHSALHSARVSVVNIIFLRFINPIIIDIVGKLPGNTTIQFIGARLSQIFQGQVNGINVIKKFPEMSESGDLIATTGAIIEDIIGKVCEAGQAQAQVLAAQRPPPTRSRSGFVIGSRPRG